MLIDEVKCITIDSLGDIGRVEESYYALPLSFRSVHDTFASYGSRYIRGLTLAHVKIVVTRLMYCYKILILPIVVISV